MTSCDHFTKSVDVHIKKQSKTLLFKASFSDDWTCCYCCCDCRHV